MEAASGSCDEPLAFSYHRGMAPILWVFVGLASIELCVVHLLVAIWWPKAALMLSALSLASILWVLALIRSLKTRPVLLYRDRILLRAGRLRSFDLLLEDVSTIDRHWTSEELRRRDASNLALIAHPNLCFRLRQPLAGGRRRTALIFHRLDDLPTFTAALERFQPGMPGAK